MLADELEILQQTVVALEQKIANLKTRGFTEIKKRPQFEKSLVWMGIVFGIPAILKKPWLLGLIVGYHLLKKQAEKQTV